jgi:hypothetical protein
MRNPKKTEVKASEETAAGMKEPDLVQNVKYKIRYLAEGGYFAAIEPWHVRLNLEVERKKISSKEQAILEVVTVVQTNIKSSYDRASYESRYGHVDDNEFCWQGT